MTREDILRARPSPRLREGKLTDLEGLSGMGGLDGDTPEEAFGPDFIDELSSKEDMVFHAPTPARDGGHSAFTVSESGGDLPEDEGASARLKRTE